MNYYRDFVLPKSNITPLASEADQLRQLLFALEGADFLNEEELQAIPFELARKNNIDQRCFSDVLRNCVRAATRPSFRSFAKMLGLDTFSKC